MTLPEPEALSPLPDPPRVVDPAPLAPELADVSGGRFADRGDPDRAQAFVDRIAAAPPAIPGADIAALDRG
jgi:hypothetical protein